MQSSFYTTFFEDYKNEHIEAIHAIEKELERLSENHSDACIIFPKESSVNRIEGELRDNQHLWRRFSANL